MRPERVLVVVLLLAVLAQADTTASPSIRRRCRNPEHCLILGRQPCTGSRSEVVAADLLAGRGSRSAEDNNASNECGECFPEYEDVYGECIDSKPDAQRLLQKLAKLKLFHQKQDMSTRIRGSSVKLHSTTQQQVAIKEAQTNSLLHDRADSRVRGESEITRPRLPEEGTSKAALTLAARGQPTSRLSSLQRNAASVAPEHSVDHSPSIGRADSRNGQAVLPVASASSMNVHGSNLLQHPPLIVGSQAINGEGFVPADTRRRLGGDLSHLLFFAVVLSSCILSVVVITAASVCWHRSRVRRDDQRKDSVCCVADSVEYACFSPKIMTSKGRQRQQKRVPKGSRAVKVAVGDGKLAQSALRYHYERSKLRMLSSSSSSLQRDRSMSDNVPATSEGEDAYSDGICSGVDEEDESGDYTVYECPGLAPTSEMEVTNPLFDGKIHKSSSGSSSMGSPVLEKRD